MYMHKYITFLFIYIKNTDCLVLFQCQCVPRHVLTVEILIQPPVPVNVLMASMKLTALVG